MFSVYWKNLPSMTSRSQKKMSFIIINIILILIFLFVLLPSLDQAVEKEDDAKEVPIISDLSANMCSMSLVESVPKNHLYPSNATFHTSTYDTWLNLINSSHETIEIATFYWTLRKFEVYPDTASSKGEDIFQALLTAGLKRKIKVRIAQNMPSQSNPNTNAEYLAKRKAAEVRSLNFPHLLVHGGVLHTKLLVIDRTHFYLGSPNMDWRALTEVNEMGVVVRNCPELAQDIGKIFDVYWTLGVPGAKVPSHWPVNFQTKINMDTPINLKLNNDTFAVYVASSPPPLSPIGRTNDLDAILNVIQKAEKFIYISVMDYFPLTIYTPKIQFWPVLDNALRSAALNKINVRLLISESNRTRSSQHYFLKSLSDLNDAYPEVSIEVRYFIVPANCTHGKMHSKYMVTDNTAYIGTSNWAGDYFINTAGVGMIVHDPMYNRNHSHVTIRSQLQAVFERDWYSNYSFPLS